jgi:hypothetical protein
VLEAIAQVRQEMRDGMATSLARIAVSLETIAAAAVAKLSASQREEMDLILSGPSADDDDES